MSKKFLKVFPLVFVIFACSSITFGQVRSGAGIGQGPLKSGISPARILSKPDPELPEGASVDSEGTIVLRAILSRDGKVKDVRFVKSTLRDTRKGHVDALKKVAIQAAKKIKFTPATRDGRPVSMHVELEYSFELEDEPKPPAGTPEAESPKSKAQKPKV